MIFFKMFLCLILLFAATITCSTAAETQSDNHQEYGFVRQKMVDQANSTDAKVTEKIQQLQRMINNSLSVSDASHNAETIKQLRLEHRQWLDYRDSHCRLKSYVYAYPVISKLSADEYNACKVNMNRTRLRFLNDIAYEFE